MADEDFQGEPCEDCQVMMRNIGIVSAFIGAAAGAFCVWLVIRNG